MPFHLKSVENDKKARTNLTHFEAKTNLVCLLFHQNDICDGSVQHDMVRF